MSDSIRPTDPLLTMAILPALARFSVPTMVAMVATALAAIAETAYVGSFGVSALAGMALVFPMIMLQMMLSGGAMGGGVSSAVSRAIGAGDMKRANAVSANAFWIGLGAGILNMGLMLMFGPAIYAILGGRDESLSQAIIFSSVAFTGSIGVWLMNTFASILRGCGNMFVPSATIFLVAVLQVAAGGTLGLGWGPFPRLGMFGVAAGQVIAFSIGALYLYYYLSAGRARIHLVLSRTRPSAELMGDILKVGALACISPLQTVLTILILTRLVAQFGPTTLAGYGIGTRLEFLLVPVAFAIGVASVPLVGVAIGAGWVERARRVAWIAALLAAFVLGLFGLVLALVPDVWTRNFTSEPGVIESARLYFRWAGPFYALYGMGLCLYFSSLAAGKVGGPVFAGTVRLMIVAIGGWMLANAQTPPWTIFALIALAMVAYGLVSALTVRSTNWGS